VDIPTLETERLILRAFKNSDFEAYAGLFADPEVSEFISVSGEPMDRLASWRHMATALGHWQLRGFGLWAVEEKASGTFVGRLGLYYPETWPGKEVGYAIAREHWGKGYATEGASAARDYAFTKLQWPEIISIINPANTRSIAVAKRLGETFKETWSQGDLEFHVYGLSRADWENLER